MGQTGITKRQPKKSEVFERLEQEIKDRLMRLPDGEMISQKELALATGYKSDKIKQIVESLSHYAPVYDENRNGRIYYGWLR